jgi:hypothetical protein
LVDETAKLTVTGMVAPGVELEVEGTAVRTILLFSVVTVTGCEMTGP